MRHLPADIARRLYPAPLIPAAVLVGLTAGDDGWEVLMTRRTEHLRDHPGQISFPGGRLEPGDAGPVAAALREAREEVGIEAAYIDVIGHLPSHAVVTGFAVSPVVAILRPGFTLAPDTTEVAEIFSVPLSYLLDPANLICERTNRARRQPSGVRLPVRSAPSSGAPRRTSCNSFGKGWLSMSTRRDIRTLLEIMATLRDPVRGCPWDREQDFASIAPYTIEEAYEVADAIERDDLTDLRDELGDLLLQVVFHAQMASEIGAFDFDDVVAAISDKMMRRHPHVFGTEVVASAEAQSSAWEVAQGSRARSTGRGRVRAGWRRSALPALVRAEKLGKRAARVGLDWPDTGGVLRQGSGGTGGVDFCAGPAGLRGCGGRAWRSPADLRQPGPALPRGPGAGAAAGVPEVRDPLPACGGRRGRSGPRVAEPGRGGTGSPVGSRQGPRAVMTLPQGLWHSPRSMSEPHSDSGWHPASWLARTAGQIPAYRNQQRAAAVMAELARLPPLVTSWEVDALRSQLALAGEGKAFVLQGGDCAETFDDCRSDAIVTKLKILLQMSVVIISGLKRPVVRVGRMAGQYAKPRSADTETRTEQTLPSYRGDIINRNAFTAQDREPDPELMLRAYERSAPDAEFRPFTH